MRIIGIDPGTGILGFGVIDVNNKELKCIDAGVIKTPAHQEDSVRLEAIHSDLSDLITEFAPDIMSVEKLFFARNVTTAMSVAQARGIVLLLGKKHCDKIYEYTPLQIKQALTGYGKADKKQVQEMVKTILKLKQIPKPDDAADALAAAITCSMSIKN